MIRRLLRTTCVAESRRSCAGQRCRAARARAFGPLACLAFLVAGLGACEQSQESERAGFAVASNDAAKALHDAKNNEIRERYTHFDEESGLPEVTLEATTCDEEGDDPRRDFSCAIRMRLAGRMARRQDRNNEFPSSHSERWDLTVDEGGCWEAVRMEVMKPVLGDDRLEGCGLQPAEPVTYISVKDPDDGNIEFILTGNKLRVFDWPEELAGASVSVTCEIALDSERQIPYDDDGNLTGGPGHRTTTTVEWPTDPDEPAEVTFPNALEEPPGLCLLEYEGDASDVVGGAFCPDIRDERWHDESWDDGKTFEGECENLAEDGLVERPDWAQALQ